MLLATSACEGADQDARVEVEQERSALVSCASAGSDEAFYTFTGTLPAKNGALIKCEKLFAEGDAGTPPGSRAYRVLYRTSTLVHAGGNVTELGLVASGQIVVPTAAATGPDGGLTDRPVIADTHGATGVLPACGPSRSRARDGTPSFLSKVMPGAVVVYPDYVGLGVDHKYRVPEAGYLVTWPNGAKSAPFSNITHPIVSIESEGRATVDIVRAAREITTLPTQVKWITLGQSQGGHAAIATAEVVKRHYADELNLLGVVAGAPASELDQDAWWEPSLKNALFGMVAASLPLEWRDIKASKYLSDAAMMAVSDVPNRICFGENTLLETLAKYGLVPDMWRVNPWLDPTTKAILGSMSPGREPVGVPMFVGTVRGDPLVAHQRTASYVASARQKSPNLITFCEYNGPVAANQWPALSRAQNHNAFREMFATQTVQGVTSPKPPHWGCTLDNSPIKATDPVGFVEAVYKRSF